MTLLHDILKWTEGLPMWQRDATRRLLQKGAALTDDDYKELYALMKAEHGIPKPKGLKEQPLATGHLPATTRPGETIILEALRDLENVNCISPDQNLTFNETGITVIYGGNASGKSGYARVMKRACRARDQSEPIHPNANDATTKGSIPTAKFDIKVAGTSQEVSWSHDVTSPDQLSTIAVFDSKCARSYLMTEQDVAYLPYGLDIVENLANQVLPNLSQRLEDEINAIRIDKQSFEHLLGETEVGNKIGTLNANSNPDEIKALGTLSNEDTKRLEELGKTLKEADPLAKARELLLSATRLGSLAEKISEPLAWVSNQAVTKLQKLDEDRTRAESAEAKAADALRSGEDLLSGTGDQVWKLLFEAARRYSNEVAYPDATFPSLTEGAVCPLCQEPLPPNANQRLARFEEYVKNDIAKIAKEKREKAQIAKDKIERADLKIIDNNPIVDEIRQLDKALPKLLTAFEASLERRRRSMLGSLGTHKWSETPDLSENPRPNIQLLASQQLKKSKTFSRMADKKNRVKLEAEYTELIARHNLSQSLQPILGLIQRMRNRAALEKCRLSLQTRSISEKSKEFASTAVTNELKNALDREFKNLGVENIKTKLKERSSRGQRFYQLLLDLPNRYKLDEILSEGEQRMIALGSFLAELSLADYDCGIVFDDPVSSLDHKWRGKVAKRLAQESPKRQVIIFTHDVVFLSQVRDELKKLGGEPKIYSLNRNNTRSGVVTDGLPWAHKSIDDRIDKLEKEQRKIERIFCSSGSSDELSMYIIHQYSLLRATIERVVQDCVLNRTVQRFRDYISIRNLENVVGFPKSEFDEVVRLNQKCNDVTDAHDPSSAKDEPSPTPSELKQDICDLKNLVEVIKSRQRGGVSAPADN